MNKKKNLNIKQVLNEMNRTSRLLKKNFIFEDYGEMPQDEFSEEEGMGQNEMGMEEEPQVDNQTVNIINQIRELAIQGIAQYANDVESEEYQALKKIWLLTDKFYEGMNDDEEKSKKF